MAILFLLLVMVPAAAFLDREKGLHFFTLPELRSPLHHALVKAGHGGKKWRALKAAPDGTFPEIHDSHEFVGATEYGFVSMNYSAIVKSTTVQTDDVSEAQWVFSFVSFYPCSFTLVPFLPPATLLYPFSCYPHF